MSGAKANHNPAINAAAPTAAAVCRTSAPMIEIVRAVIVRSSCPAYGAGFGGMLRTDHSPVSDRQASPRLMILVPAALHS